MHRATDTGHCARFLHAPSKNTRDALRSLYRYFMAAYRIEDVSTFAAVNGCTKARAERVLLLGEIFHDRQTTHARREADT